MLPKRTYRCAASVLYLFLFGQALLASNLIHASSSPAISSERYAIDYQNVDYQNLEENLKFFGCREDIVRAALRGNPNFDLVPSRDEKNTARRYRWDQHEMRIIGPNQDGESYVEKTILSSKNLPDIFSYLLSNIAKGILIDYGFASSRIQNNFKEGSSLTLEIFSNRYWQSKEEYYSYVHVVFLGEELSTLTWFCGG